MLIEDITKYYKKLTSANAKMEEYKIDISERIKITEPIEKVFLTAIGIIGEVAANIQRDNENYKIILEKNKDDLLFSAKFIEDYYNGNLNINNANLYLIIASVAYYLAGNVGSSKVLIKKVKVEELNINVNGLDYAIISLLKDEFDSSNEEKYNGKYKVFLLKLKENMTIFCNEYYMPPENNKIKKRFRNLIYKYANDMELLFTDVFLTIFDLKINNSFIKLSNEYINIENDSFKKKLMENNKIKELWPSQRNIGENGIFKGKSAVIQLPTGTGKTKSLTILLSVHFLNAKKKIAVIIAPFRALCREISNDLEKDFGKNENIKVDEINDILNEDNIFSLENTIKTVIVVTPEKFNYILKKQKDIIDEIGLIILDEGHIFDEWERGINYELLISNLKLLLKEDTQKILISAVASNLDKINQWLNDGNGVVVKNNLLKTTEKSICFVDWKNSCGYLNFLNPIDMTEEFYVPRFIRVTELKKMPQEKSKRFFPMLDFKRKVDKFDDVALYCGIKLCTKGATIIFCGNKKTPNKILKRLLELKTRGYNISSLKEKCNSEEIKKLSYIISKNYGENNEYYYAAKEGAFVHQADISNGVKISLEYAMKHELISFLICTSTLAQGVNLPIKYLIMTGIYQANSVLKVRDFNNLIGRAGRPGMYTEGTVIFSDPFVYTYKQLPDYKNKWNKYKELILSNLQDDEMSMLLKISQNEIIELIEAYYNESFEEKLKTYLLKFYKYQMKNEERKIRKFIQLLSSIENFLMSYLNNDKLEDNIENIEKITKETLGYYLSSEEQKNNILKLFILISKYCLENVPVAKNRFLYSQNVFGVKENNLIENFINENFEKIINSDSEKQLFENLNNLIIKIQGEDIKVKKICDLWLEGYSYKEIIEKCDEELEINECLKICNQKISYAIPLIISAVEDNIKSKIEEDNKILDIFNLLVKELKYGIKSDIGIMIYELGFSDREVAKEIEEYLNDNVNHDLNVFNVKDSIIEKKEEILNILNKYPSVFTYQLNLL